MGRRSLVSEQAKATIDAMSADELRFELNKRNRSRFQGDNYAYLETRLAELDDVAQTNRHERDLEQQRETNKWNRILAYAAIASLVVALLALLNSVWPFIPNFFRETVRSDWIAVVVGKDSETYSTEAITSDIALPPFKSISGKVKFLDVGMPSDVALGYKISVDVPPLDLSKVPAKYLKRKPISVGSKTFVQLPIEQVTYDLRFSFTLRDKDGFVLGELQSESESIESGRSNELQKTN